MLLSRSGRESSISSDRSLTYGEIVHGSFLQILDSVRKMVDLPPGGTFVDLGCGTGKAVITAALSNLHFSTVWGIELLQPLAAAAAEVADRMKMDFSNEGLAAGAGIGVATALDKKKSDKLKSLPSVPSVKDVIMSIASSINSCPDRALPCDSVVNTLCQQYGHKGYKAFLKPLGSFKKFISKHSDLFVLDGNTLVAMTEAETLTALCRAIKETEETSSAPPASEAISVDTAALRALLPLPDHVLMQCGDIFQIDWFLEASVVYCASLLFSESMLDNLHALCLEMRPGAVFISLRPFPKIMPGCTRYLELISDSFYRMSWQMAKVYIYQIRNCEPNNTVE